MIIAEYEPSGLFQKFVHGPGQDEPLYFIQGDRRDWYHADERGSVIGTSTVDGVLRRIVQYDEYGRPGAKYASFMFTGAPYVLQGTYLMRNRFYDFLNGGRFLQADPIGYGDGPNMYTYVGGDPINVTDPSGTMGRRSDGDAGFVLGSLIELGIGLWNADSDAGRARAHERFEDRMRVLAPDLPRSGGTAGQTARAAQQSQRTFQTYIKVNPKTGERYAGRTSGTGTPAQNVARRDASHHKVDFGPARLDKSSTNAQAIRGREQQLIERHGGAQSKGGTSGNSINGISERNPNGAACRAAATKEFGSC